jgi:hypothetical protein
MSKSCGKLSRDWWWLAPLILYAANATAAGDAGLAVMGEQELPKVLYVVPWKDPALGEPLPAPTISVDDSILAPLNRDAFRGQLQYQAGLIEPKPADRPATDNPRGE